jgi:hypothetical protein
MPDLMAASDLLIQNAGGVTCLEAFSIGLPVVMFDPLPGHGEDNARHMARHGTVALAEREPDLARLITNPAYWDNVAPGGCQRARALFDRPSVAAAIGDGASVCGAGRDRSARTAVRVVIAAALIAGVLEASHAGEELADGGVSPAHAHSGD